MKRRVDKEWKVDLKTADRKTWEKLKALKHAIAAENLERKETAAKKKRKNRRPKKGGGYSKQS